MKDRKITFQTGLPRALSIALLPGSCCALQAAAQQQQCRCWHLLQVCATWPRWLLSLHSWPAQCSPFRIHSFPLNSLPANIYQNSCLLRQRSKMPEHGTKEIYLGKGVLEVSHSSTLQPLLPPANLRMAWFEYVNVMSWPFMPLQEIILYHYICVRVIKFVFDFYIKPLIWFYTFLGYSLEAWSSNVTGKGTHLRVSATIPRYKKSANSLEISFPLLL